LTANLSHDDERLKVDRKGVTPMSSSQEPISCLRGRLEAEEGQTMAEYGVVLAVITIGVFLALGLLSGNVTNAINTVAGYL
jgi:Flp pilus assembly pilin Flp